MSILFSDFDGTYHTEDCQAIVNSIAIDRFRKDGHKFALTSGRDHNSLKRVVKEFNIPYDYLVCCDGTIVYDNQGNLLQTFYIDPSVTQETNQLVRFAKPLYREYVYPDGYSSQYIKGKPITGCAFTFEKDANLDTFRKAYYEIQKEYPNLDFFEYIGGEERFFIVRKKGINKGSAITHMRNNGIISNSEDVFTAGDGDNDIELLRDHNGYYIGNATDGAREVAIAGYDQLYQLVVDIRGNKVLRR